DGADEAGALSRLIPADGLAQIGGDQGANDAENRRNDETSRVTTGHDDFRHQPGKESDDDRPENLHGRNPPIPRQQVQGYDREPRVSPTLANPCEVRHASGIVREIWSLVMPEFEEWESFYVIVGAAAGALIGLQFVVMTLTAERPPLRAAEAGRAFAT